MGFAGRLSPGRPLTAVNTENLRRKLLPAFGLSFVLLILMFVLDEIFIGSRAVFLWSNLRGLLLYVGCLGAFSGLAQFFLSFRHPRAVREDWPIVLMLNSVPLAMSLVSLVLEPGDGRPEALYLTFITIACSCVGAGVAARLARDRAPLQHGD